MKFQTLQVESCFYYLFSKKKRLFRSETKRLNVIADPFSSQPLTKEHDLGPVHTYHDIFESATFSFRSFLNPLSRVENSKSATNPITRGRQL